MAFVATGRRPQAVAPRRMSARSRLPRRAVAASPGATDNIVIPVSVGNKKVVVLGGTGRVGSSTAAALLQQFKGVTVSVAGRSEISYTKAIERRPKLREANFIQCDIEDIDSIKAALSGADLVIHTAGPFQQSRNFNVIKAAIETKTPYMDVCDDTHYSESVKSSFHEAALHAGVPAITTAGIYPGTSNVMAAHIVSIARGEYDEAWNLRQPAAGEGIEPKLLRYSYYTAGSGGAGPTILETSFLLAGEDCIVYKEGKAYTLPPISQRREVDFGPGVGRKGVYLYQLPEVASSHRYMRVPGVSARFGTDPFIWNWAMWIMARLVPRSVLQDRAKVRGIAQMADPFVRAVDKIVGEAVAMRVEVDFEGDKNASGIFVHKYLSQAMGASVMAFAWAVLSGQTQPGVWFPEQAEAVQDRRTFFKLASRGCFRFDLNRSAWALESEVRQIGGLIYW